MGLEPLAAAVGHFVRLKRPQPATVGNRLDPGLLGNLNRRGGAVQHLHQLGLLGLAALFLGDRRLDPLGLGQQFVVPGLASLRLSHGRTLALSDGLVAFHRRLGLLLLEHPHFGQSGGEFVEKLFNAAGHVDGSCVCGRWLTYSHGTESKGLLAVARYLTR